jgi:dihydroneopterin aldolase
MDKIIITDLVARGVIGVEHPERDNAQDLLINLTLALDLSHAGLSDSICDTVSYSAVVKAVRQRVAESSFHLVESLAESLAQMLLEQYPFNTVTVRVEKQRFVKGTERVGVEIERGR